MDPREETRRVLEEIRRIIKASPLSQRKVEDRAGFSRGYLSQLLARNLDLKFIHLIAILDALDRPPGAFFRSLYPDPRRPALEHFKAQSRLPSVDVRRSLEDLYDVGLESLHRLRERLERCEDAVTRLEDLGVLPSRARGGDEP